MQEFACAVKCMCGSQGQPRLAASSYRPRQILLLVPHSPQVLCRHLRSSPDGTPIRWSTQQEVAAAAMGGLEIPVPPTSTAASHRLTHHMDDPSEAAAETERNAHSAATALHLAH